MKRFITYSEIRKSLAIGEISSVELVANYLSQIKQKDKELNAFITVTDEYAYKKAKEIDRKIADNKNAFEDFPLLGMVISLKDLYITKGIRTTAASNVLRDYVPQYSGTVVNRLEAAGAIIIGKTNCDAWAHGASGENSDFGATKNPWNTEYVPGGSSSGSAASVAAEMSFAAMGTDTGGSIRQPASFCSVVGFKPTYGAVSRYGVVAMGSSRDCIGHFTHTVEDAERIFNVTAGADGHDGTIAYLKNNTSGTVSRVGIPKEYFAEGLDPEVRTIVEKAIKTLESDGVSVEEVSLPHTKYAISVYYIVMPAEVSSNLGRYDGIRFGGERVSFGREARRRIMLGTYVLSSGYYDAYYLKAMKVRTKIIEDFSRVFEKVDALVAPVSPTPAFKLGERTTDPLQMYLADVYTVSGNLAGIPGLSVPAGFTSSGLPVGMQVLTPQFHEGSLFSLGKRYQKLTNWHTKFA